jgi:hypothetical protein
MRKENYNRVLPAEAAEILGTSTMYIYLAMQQGKLPIGTAIKTSSIWTYHISSKLLEEYSGVDVQSKLREIRNRKK